MPEETAQFVWKLARRHAWGSPVPDEQLIRLVAGTGGHDELERVREEEVRRYDPDSDETPADATQ